MNYWKNKMNCRLSVECSNRSKITILDQRFWNFLHFYILRKISNEKFKKILGGIIRYDIDNVESLNRIKLIK